MKRFDNPDVIIADVMDSHGKWRVNKPAVICGDERITWGEFNRRINKVANGLIKRGLQKGDKVSLLSTNRLEVLEILFGTVKAGGVIVPLSAMVPGDSLARMVIDSDSRFLFVGPGQRDNIGPYRSEFSNIAADGFFALGDPVEGWNSFQSLVDESSDEKPGISLIYEDPFNIMYTSGTTGVPKGILHSHHNRTQFASMFAIDYRIDSSAVNIVTTALYANGTWLTMPGDLGFHHHPGQIVLTLAVLFQFFLVALTASLGRRHFCLGKIIHGLVVFAVTIMTTDFLRCLGIGMRAVEVLLDDTGCNRHMTTQAVLVRELVYIQLLGIRFRCRCQIEWTGKQHSAAYY